jgi:hypothetical protein
MNETYGRTIVQFRFKHLGEVEVVFEVRVAFSCVSPAPPGVFETVLLSKRPVWHENDELGVGGLIESIMNR